MLQQLVTQCDLRGNCEVHFPNTANWVESFPIVQIEVFTIIQLTNCPIIQIKSLDPQGL